MLPLESLVITSAALSFFWMVILGALAWLTTPLARLLVSQSQTLKGLLQFPVFNAVKLSSICG